jgi:WD40 repeat protein/DNA-binding SARP family transcriptional activator
MEFRILGPLEVHDQRGPVPLGGSKPRAVLAVLLLHANQPVSADRLALALWGDDAPANAVKTVQVHVSRLRKALGDVAAIETSVAGYRLRVGPDELDADRFERLVADGRRALATGQAEHAADVLGGALSLWRGPPLAGLEFEPFAATEIARLEERRLSALESRLDADLAAGRHADTVTELQRLVADHPARERFAALLMLALYRCGRQTDALDAYHDARLRLSEEVGLDPGPELRELEQAILRHDEALALAAVAELPRELVAVRDQAVAGRDGELMRLRESLRRASSGTGALVIIAGPPGIGKTRVAAELAAEAHGAGADVLYVRGDAPPEAARVALRRARDATRPTLIVVDDADASHRGVADELAEFGPEVARRPVLALVSMRDPQDLPRLEPTDVFTLPSLGAEAVRDIAAAHAPAHVRDAIPVAWLLEESAGVPARLHELAREWARREMSRRLDTVAARARNSRKALRSAEAELAGDVLEFQVAEQRSAFDEDGDAPVTCPYKGLASFGTSDTEYFFGRERLVAELVARLVGAPLLGVVGPSGSGKSSVLRAGLLPALAAGVLPGSEAWEQVVIRPGEHPLRELQRETADIDRGRRVVLAVDQFEETFTSCRDEDERAAFVAALAQMARGGRDNGVVVLAVRADQYGRCAQDPELAGLLADNHVLVGAMRRDELRRAVECPATRVGLRVEPRLVDALVSEVQDAPGALPLLSAALLELWQRRDGWHLRYAAYEQTGGVRGAVARLAEDAIGRLDPGRQAVARSVLLRLVREDDEGSVERRRVALAELGADRNRDVADVVALLTDRRLIIVSAGTVEVSHEALLREWPRLRGWIDDDREGLRIQRRLTNAAEEWRALGRDPESLMRGTRLAEAVEWRTAHSPPLSDLEREFLAAGEAARARERAGRRRRVRLTRAASATLAAALVVIVVALLFARRERDIAASRDLATTSSTLITTDPGLGLAVALEALRRSDTAQARSAVRQATLAHQATRINSAHRGLAFGVAPNPDGRSVATAGGDRTVRLWSVASGRSVGEIRGYKDEVRAVTFSPDGTHIASAAHDGEIATAPAGGGPRTVVARLPRGDFATSLDFDADGKSLALGTYGGCVVLIRLSDGRRRGLNSCPAAPIFAVDFDGSGRRVVSVGADGARIWSVAGGAPLELAQPGEEPGGVAASFDPDAERVATSDFSGGLRLWDARTGRQVMRVRVGEQPLASVRFSGDGRRLVTGAYDGVISVVAVRGGSVLAELRGHHGPARVDFVSGSRSLVSAGEEDGTLRTWLPSMAKVSLRAGTAPLFSRDDRLVVSGDPTGPIHVWSPSNGADRVFAGHTDVSYAQLSPDGTQIVSASHDESVRVWDVRSGRSRLVSTLKGLKYAAAIDASGERIAIGGATPLVIQAPDGTNRVLLRGHGGYVNALAFNPGSTRLLTGSDDGTARVWDARSGRAVRTLRGHEGTVRGVAYSDDGKRIATAGSDGTIRVWSADGGEATILVGHEGAVNSARFNGRGDRIVSAGVDGSIRVWDAAGGPALLVLYRYQGAASGADFARDGHSVVSAGDEGMRITPCGVCGTLAGALALARTRALHALTAAERQRLVPGG